MKNKRDAAIAAGDLKYNSGKPCRKGHTSDRYSSNGMCIACVTMMDNARRDAREVSRRKYINAREHNFQERVFLVREDQRTIVEKFCEILQYGDGFLVASMIANVERHHENTPTPRTLTYDDLVKFMEWDGKKVNNIRALEMDGIIQTDPDDGYTYIVHNKNKYFGKTVMEVLKKERNSVKPV